MPSVARMSDMWVGICVCHLPPIPMTGFIISASSNHLSGGLGVARIGDMTIGICGHPGIIVSGSSINLTNGPGKAYIGSSVTGCNIGTIVSGNPTHITG